MDPERDLTAWLDGWDAEVERTRAEAHRTHGPRAALDAVDALIAERDHELQALGNAVLRAARERAGTDAFPVFTDDEQLKLNRLRWQRIQLKATARRVQDNRDRLVEPPDGDPYLLPAGHTFAGFGRDGQVMSGSSSVEIHTPTEQPDRWATAAKVAGNRVRLRSHVRQRRGSCGRPRAASRRVLSSTRAGPSDDDGSGEPPPPQRPGRYLYAVLTTEQRGAA